MTDPTQAEGTMETEDTREAPWTVTEFFLDPRRYNPSAAILHKEANVRLSTAVLSFEVLLYEAQQQVLPTAVLLYTRICSYG